MDVPFDEKLGISVRVCNITLSSIYNNIAELQNDTPGLLHMQVQNLYKEYHVRKTDTIFKAAQDVSLEFPANQIIALLGPSGSGKTTLLRLIAGLEKVTSGQIFFGGKPNDHVPLTPHKF